MKAPSPQQWDILGVLIASRAIVPAWIIAERVRSDSPKAMAVQICHIRKRFPDIGQHIQTVRSEGYRWTGPRDVAAA